MSSFNYQSKNPNILKSSRDITMSLGKMSFSKGITVSENLKIILGKTGVSLWKMYEVNLTIYCFPGLDTKVSKLKSCLRLLKNNLLEKKRFINIRLFGTNKNELKIPSNEYILFLGFPDYLANENFQFICDKITKDNIYNILIIADKPTGPDWGNDLRLDINNISCTYFRSREVAIRRLVHNKIKEMKLNVKRSELSKNFSAHILRALDFIRPKAEYVTPKYLALAEHLLYNNPPAAIVSLDVANPNSRAFTLMANILNIPVVQIQAGPISQECIEWSFCEDDLMLSHGSKVEFELKELGFLGKTVIPVGSAKHENIRLNQDSYNQTKDIWPTKEKLLKKNIRILFLTSYTDVFFTSETLKKQFLIYNEMYLSIISEISKFCEISLIIKPHPLEKAVHHKKFSLKYKNIFVVEPTENTLGLIKGADVVISFGSTASIDAVIENKLVMIPQFPDFNLTPYFEKADYCLIPKNRLELSRIMSQLVNGELASMVAELNESRERFLKSINYFNESPSRAIVEEIYHLIDRCRTQKIF